LEDNVKRIATGCLSTHFKLKVLKRIRTRSGPNIMDIGILESLSFISARVAPIETNAAIVSMESIEVMGYPNQDEESFIKHNPEVSDPKVGYVQALRLLPN